jgi:hypothetical protein
LYGQTALGFGKCNTYLVRRGRETVGVAQKNLGVQ